jgi:hypothetical protein
MAQPLASITAADEKEPNLRVHLSVNTKTLTTGSTIALSPVTIAHTQANCSSDLDRGQTSDSVKRLIVESSRNHRLLHFGKA